MGTATTQRLLLFLIVVVTVAVYTNSLDNSFHYDDIHSLVQNPHIRSLSNLPAFFYDSQTFSGWGDRAMYRPLVLASYALNHATGGYQVRGYHLVNLVVHLLNVILVFSIGRTVVSRQKQGGAAAGAYVAALIFAVHPINSEVVNYISSRSESLVASATWRRCTRTCVGA
jgi:hypothetical protein